MLGKNWKTNALGPSHGRDLGVGVFLNAIDRPMNGFMVIRSDLVGHHRRKLGTSRQDEFGFCIFDD